MNPAPPARRNVDRQPHACAMKGIVSGAHTAATLAAELKIAVANARSRLGNHWAVALIAEGKFPASPNPSASRAPKNPRMLPTSACDAAASDHSAIDTE